MAKSSAEKIALNKLANKYGIDRSMAGADEFLYRKMREEVYEINDKILSKNFYNLNFDKENKTVDKRTSAGKADKKAYSKDTHNYFESEAERRDVVRDYYYDIKTGVFDTKSNEYAAKAFLELDRFAKSEDAIYKGNMLVGFKASNRRRAAENASMRTRAIKSTKIPLEVRRYIEAGDDETAREYFEFLADLKRRIGDVDVGSDPEAIMSMMDDVMEGGYTSTRKAKNVLTNFIRFQISGRGEVEVGKLINQAYSIKAGGRSVFGVREKNEFSEYIKSEIKYKGV